jgi:hypothetical protein
MPSAFNVYLKAVKNAVPDDPVYVECDDCMFEHQTMIWKPPSFDTLRQAADFFQHEHSVQLKAQMMIYLATKWPNLLKLAMELVEKRRQTNVNKICVRRLTIRRRALAKAKGRAKAKAQPKASPGPGDMLMLKDAK